MIYTRPNAIDINVVFEYFINNLPIIDDYEENYTILKGIFFMVVNYKDMSIK